MSTISVSRAGASVFRSGRLLKNVYQQKRFSSRLPLNIGILFVPQQEAWVVERFGKYRKILSPGLNLLLPIINRVAYVQSLKEIAIEVPEQRAITSDNVTLMMDGVLYLRVKDPYKASYGVEDPEFAITQLAQTTMRSEIGKISLDTVFKERDSLNSLIVEAINKASEAWGILCLRYEIKDIQIPERVKEAMQMQVEAERKKRASILQSEGIREADINVAQGKRQAKILHSEAVKNESINIAAGEAEAMLVTAQAKAKSVEMIAKAMEEKYGMNAVSFRVAEGYVEAFSNLAKQGNTILLPANTGDIASMVSQAMAIYGNVSKQQADSKPTGRGSGNMGFSLDSSEQTNTTGDPEIKQHHEYASKSDTHTSRASRRERRKEDTAEK